MPQKYLTFSNYNDVFDLLISEEEKAVELYNSLASRSETLEYKQTFKQLSREETGHISRLKAMREHYHRANFPAPVSVKADLMVRPTRPFNTQTLKAIFQSAINEETHAEKLYLKIAGQVQDQELQQLFDQMAEHEKNHRLRLEKLLSYF